MSKVSFTQKRASANHLMTTIRSANRGATATTPHPTGTRLTGQASTTRRTSMTAYSSYVTTKAAYYTTSYKPLPYSSTGGSSGVQLPSTRVTVGAVIALWVGLQLGAVIYVLFFSKTAKRERRRKDQRMFGQNQFQNRHAQQYVPIPEDSLYSQLESHYAYSKNSPYDEIEKSTSQMSYIGYQNYNFGGQGTNWPTYQPGTPSAGSSISGHSPGYIPPGAEAAPV